MGLHANEDIGEVRFGVDAVGFACDDKRHHRSQMCRTGIIGGEEIVLASQGDQSQPPLALVVVRRQRRIIEKLGESIPLVEPIPDGSGDRALGSVQRLLLLEPPSELIHERFARALSKLSMFVRAEHACHGGLAFDLVDVDEGVEHVSRRLGRGAECLEEITAKVGQAPGTVTASDIADVVVPGVAVNQQGSGCPAEDTQRRLAGTVTAVAIENQLGADERPDEAATA